MGKIKTSKTELLHLLKAWIAVSLAFGILLSGRTFSAELLKNILISGITVGVGFLFHEMGHKVVAQRFGCFAEFRSNNFMLIIAIATALFGFVFAAPGAVIIAGKTTLERQGKIALAGPLVNLAMAVVFWQLSNLAFLGEPVRLITQYGFMINSWLAFFNMLPFGILDGKKVKLWSSKAYWATTLIAAAFMFFIEI